MENKKSNKMIWLFVSLALIFVLAVGLVFLWWQKSASDRRLHDEKAKLRAEIKRAEEKIEDLREKTDELESESEEETTAANTVTPTAPAGGPPPTTSGESGTQWCYVKKVYTSEGKTYLDVDYIQFLTGAAADKAAIEDGFIQPGEHVDNDFYIRNQNPKIRKFPAADGAEVIFHWYNQGTEADPQMTEITSNLATLKQIFETNDPSNQGVIVNPYKIVLQNGLIVKIEQIYIP